MFSQILASRLEPHVAFCIIHTGKDTSSPSDVLSVDAEKAFDRVEWDYLWGVLERLGLGTNVIKTATIITNGISSPRFHITHSCGQGCFFSLFLFAHLNHLLKL